MQIIDDVEEKLLETANKILSEVFQGKLLAVARERCLGRGSTSPGKGHQ